MYYSKQFYEWVIVGGGLHGLALGGALIKTGLYSTGDLAIVDPNPTPLWAWRKRVANCGMVHMRSDVRYHLDCWPECKPYTLTEWAGKEWPADQHIILLDEAADHRVASVPLFHAHCDWFIDHYHLEQTWHQGNVQKLQRHPGRDGWQLFLANGDIINTRRVALATGSVKLNSPAWAKSLKPVYHLLDLTAPPLNFRGLRHVTVIGAGLSSANFILDLYRNASPPPQIVLVNRGPFKTSIVEADLSALEKPFQNEFQQSDYATRRDMINHTRVNGSIPPLTLQRLNKTSLEVIEAEVEEARENEGGLELLLTNGERLQTQAVVLGTGFARGTEQFSLIKQIANDYGMPLSECGFPMPGYRLEWLDGLYLMGGAAELELGPISRNLAGAGQSVARILS